MNNVQKTGKIKTSLTMNYSGPICVKLRQDVVETLYHCTICEDFAACVACYKNDNHPHKMEKLRFNLEGGGGEA